MILYFHHTDLTSNPYLGNHDGFSKNLFGFLRYSYALLFHTTEVSRNLYGYKNKSYP